MFEKQGEKSLLFLKNDKIHINEKKSHLHVDFKIKMHIIENREGIMR